MELLCRGNLTVEYINPVGGSVDQRYSQGAVTHEAVMGKLTLLSKERFVFALRIYLLSGITFAFM